MSSLPSGHKALFSLPSEIINHILRNLDLRSLLKCKEACKKLKDHIESTKEVQYLIELEIAGFERNPNNNWSTVECLQCLQKYQSAWERLEWSKEQTVPMLDGGLWDLYGGILVQTNRDGVFHFTKLSSVTRRIEEETWQITPDINDIRDFGIDPSQDLLVWISAPKTESPYVKLHLRTLKTAKIHPLARQPVLCYRQDMRPGRWHFGIKIMGDYIALKAARRASVDEDSRDSSEFLVWSWKEDKLEVALQADYLQSFTFLSDRHIVLANLYVSEDLEQDLELDTTEGYLVLLDFRAEDETRKPLGDARHSLTLCYPGLGDGAMVTEFEIASEPTPGWTPGIDDKSPFFVAKENRVFAVSMRVGLSTGFESAFDHFIPMSAFQKCLNRLGESPKQQLQFSDWAATGTRLFRASLPASNVWVCFAYGSRSMTRELPRRAGRTVSLVMYDFNQLAFQRDEAAGKQVVPGSYARIKSPGPTLGSNPVWKELESIKTFLPCSRYVKALPLPTGGILPSVMCTTDNLVLVDDKTREYRIYTF